MNPDDKSLFLDAMEDVQPLKRCADIHWQPSRNTRARQRLIPSSWITSSPLGFLELLPWMSRWHFSVKGYNRA